ncbi:MAG: AmmeMemoRadiSam system protein B [Deltaproteobacteria bacterium]|nr:AmmeMemoRadiSam system protein B [Deltaproteobacteria bacterium]
MKTRRAMLSGTWYSGTASGCRQEIEFIIKNSTVLPDPSSPVVGGIVPHAGWYYSGSIACDVIRLLSSGVSSPDALVMFGTHMYPDAPFTIMKEGAWETPLGDVAIHEPLARELCQQTAFEIEASRDDEPDNTIEVQLPFIKYFWNHIKIVPIGTPPSPKSVEMGKTVATVARKMGLNIIVLGSTDLTHYGPNYGFTPQGRGKAALQWARDSNDRSVIDAILSMNPLGIIQEAREKHNACCAGAAAAALSAGMALGAVRSRLVTYATSHEKSPGESFVGYAGIVF